MEPSVALSVSGVSGLCGFAWLLFVLETAFGLLEAHAGVQGYCFLKCV